MFRSVPCLAAAGLAAALALPAALPAQAAGVAMAVLRAPDGADFGRVTLTETKAGLLVAADLHGVPEGPHGFHIHATGACAPDFGAAGGHFVGAGDAHGMMATATPHAGDLPNIHAPASGVVAVEALKPGLTLADLFDDDGAAIVVHAGADDYASQPSGDAGGRIACGVIEGAE